MKYFKNTSWLFAEKILRMFVGLFVGIWVARYLGPEKFGLLGYARSFVGLFSAIVMLGLNSVVVKELINFPEQEEMILSTAFIMKFVMAVILFFISFIITPFFNTSIETILIYILSIAWIFQSFNVIDFYFQSKVLSKYIVLANMISLLFSSMLKIVFILIEAPLIWFTFTFVFDSIVMSIGYVYFYFKVSNRLIKFRFDYNIAKLLLTQSWPLILGGMSFVIYNNVDKIMIQKMLTSYEVGIYTAGSRLSNIWQFVPGLIVSSLMPFLVEGKKSGELIFYKRLKLISSILIWIAIILAIIYTFFSKEILNISFGNEYIKASSLMIVLIWANVFIFFNTVWNRWQLIEQNTKITFYFSLFVSIMNGILNFILINVFGVIGATYALIISLFLAYLVFYIFLNKKVIVLFLESLFLKGLYDK